MKVDRPLWFWILGIVVFIAAIALEHRYQKGVRPDERCDSRTGD